LKTSPLILGLVAFGWLFASSNFQEKVFNFLENPEKIFSKELVVFCL
jgi:hypothetical protein